MPVGIEACPDCGREPAESSWTPEVYGDDLELWLESDQPDSIVTTGGGEVSEWHDLSSHADVFAADVGNRPTTGTLTVNGVNVLQCTSATTKLLHSGALQRYKFMVDGTKPYVIAAAIGFDSGMQGYAMFLGESNWPRVHFGNDAANRIRVTQTKPSDACTSSNVSVISMSNIIGVQLNRIFAHRFDVSQPVAADRLTHGVNGATTTPNTSTANPNSCDLTAGMKVAETLRGWIGGLIIVSGDSATELTRTTLQDYFNAKFAIY
jgi:hypothetical protein